MKKMRLFVAAMMMILLFGAMTSNAATKQETFAGTVNINTATESELERLPGIGPSKAKAIVEYRQAAPFKVIEEIANVKGIGKVLAEKLKQYLRISGASLVNDSPGAAAKTN